MPVRCPICETDCADDAAECATCGKQLLIEGEPEADGPPLEGLEATILDPLESAAGAVARLPEVEDTLIADPKMEVPVEKLEVERAELELPPQAQQYWYGGLAELETGREQDGIAPTPAPVDTGACAWCGVKGTGVICDACGRRRLRGRGAAPAAPAAGAALSARERTEAAENTILCPGCFTRVLRAPRCAECHTPLPPEDLY